MAIAATMSLTHDHNNNNDTTNNKDDDHEHDMVMPGFRFHPTEEELVEFYLRRKVEGKRFNVELITFLDLYRYDPWELPALAAIGEKEWFFYVPRDRKYRNGDRPNRVTTSGYWKATGADRMIRGENSRSIGLKKTLVFYSGKAPKGIRTSWIMNEYRLPHHETERYQKAEISLCRVYKRPGVEDHPSLPRSLPSRASSSRTFNAQSDNKKQPQPSLERLDLPPDNTFGGHQIELETTTHGSSSCSDVTTALALSKATNNAYHPIPPQIPIEDEIFLNQSKQVLPLVPNCTNFFAGSSNSVQVDDLQRLINFQQACISQHQQQLYGQQQQNSQFSSTVTPLVQQHLNMLPVTTSLPTTFSDRLWEWNPMPEPNNRDYNNDPFNGEDKRLYDGGGARGE